jgi:hypothetical protein
MIVHILRHGGAFCGKPGPPGIWEKGHAWISFEDPDVNNANCPECVAGFAASGLGPGLFLGALADDSYRRPIEGSRAVPRSGCGRPTIFSRATLARPEAAHKSSKFVCLECGAAELPGLIIGPPTPEQKQELADNGVDSEAWPLRDLWGKKVP